MIIIIDIIIIMSIIILINGKHNVALFIALHFLVFLLDRWKRGYNRERPGRKCKTGDLSK